MTDKNTSVWAAFGAAQAEFTAPKQSGVNPHFKSRYSTLGDIFAVTLPALHKHGLVFVQQMDVDAEGRLTLVSRIVHAESGDAISSTLPIPAQADPQKFGSLLSYMKRYAAASLFAVVDGMDDDENAASEPTKPKTKPAPPEPDERIDAEGWDVIASWELNPEAAKQWAVEVAACDNIHEARNSLMKIVTDNFDGRLNKANVGEVLVDFYLRQAEKMEAHAEAEA